jgi:hypothetical protein
MQFRKRPVVIEATQWFKNGDHPEDHCVIPLGEIPGSAMNDGAAEMLSEGKVVRCFRHPSIHGDRICEHCKRKMHDHGFIDTLEGGHTVCPGDWIITGIQGERYPCKPEIFAATYDAI